MPSSSGPPDYTRRHRRFIFRGMSLMPQDALPPGKVAFAHNIRAYQEETVTPRVGWIRQIDNGPLAGPVHSLFRVNDTTPFADVTAPNRRWGGAAQDLFEVAPGDNTSVVVDTGYSGAPLTAVVAAPFQSPRPYLYVGDTARTRKVDGYLNLYSIGLPPPPAPPTAVYDEVLWTNLQDVSTPGWALYGGATSGLGLVSRVSTLITQLIYDAGATGMASVSLTSMVGVTQGMQLDLDAGGTPERVVVQDVYPAIAPTTIESILYDSGSTGLCTIQPVGSINAGQLEVPLAADLRHRYENLNEPAPERVTVNRPIDYPVDALILLNGVEVVRILSVAIGPDGGMSFRCQTAGTFGAGDTLTGIPSFRAYLTTTKSAGQTAATSALSLTLTPPTTDAIVGGVQTALPLTNWASIGQGATTRATQPSDIIRVNIRVSSFLPVEYVRLMLDVNPVPGNEYLQNYYLYEWRANDLLSAVQASIGAGTGLMSAAQAASVTQGQFDAAFRPDLGQQPSLWQTLAVRAAGSPPSGPGVTPGTLPASTWRQLIERARQRSPITDGYVSANSAPSRQIALGDNQWFTLYCRVGDLTRVGADGTLTYAALRAAAIIVQVSGTTTPITIDICDAYLTGGYGPDVGNSLAPIVWRYRNRSTITGERGNPSPPMRAGLKPRRGSVTLTGAACSEAQCDVQDWFRFGGSLARWAYAGTVPNGSAFTDVMEDAQIDGGEGLATDLFQPWPSYDLPRMGTCNVAGTAVEWVSGDLFDPTWAADTTIIINGRATTLYRSPASTTRLAVVDNLGTGAAVTFTLPSPTLLARPLPYLWGGPINNAYFTFACGDAADPSRILWTHGNDPDATSEANSLIVSTASEPLQNGFFFDGVPYVFSTERLYRIVPTFGQLSAFHAVETPCTKGLWAPWAFCVTPDGVVFLAQDGIYFTTAGNEARAITHPDLSPIFPQDGIAAEPIRSLNPIDMSQIARLKLTYVDHLIYFDYVDTLGAGHTLVCDVSRGYSADQITWSVDTYDQAVYARLAEPGPQVHTNLVGTADGRLYQFDLASITDNGAQIPWAIWTSWENGDDPRAWKQWGDAVLDMHPGTSFLGVTVTPAVDNGNTLLGARVVGVGGTVRDTFLIEVGTGAGGYGVIARTCGLLIEGLLDACDIQRPVLYLWEPAWVAKAVSRARRATDWSDLGYAGAKFVQGVVIRANTFGAQKAVEVQFDGPNTAPQVALTLSLVHTGERQLAYPLQDTGWNPFIAELVRLQGVDDVDWTLEDWRFVWEPAPELATHWETQDTTFDLPGYLSVRDGVIAYSADDDVELTVWHDLNFQLYTLPATGGEYQRVYVPFIATKGKAARFQLTSDLAFRLYQKDCSVRVQGWGQPGGYQVVMPFGGPHRVEGATI